MTLRFEVLLDEPKIGRIMRAGHWVLTTFPDGSGEWLWEPLPRERDEKPLKTCHLHPRAVYFDGPKCCACKAEKEFLALVKDT